MFVQCWISYLIWDLMWSIKGFRWRIKLIFQLCLMLRFHRWLILYESLSCLSKEYFHCLNSSNRRFIWWKISDSTLSIITKDSQSLLTNMSRKCLRLIKPRIKAHEWLCLETTQIKIKWTWKPSFISFQKQSAIPSLIFDTGLKKKH